MSHALCETCGKQGIVNHQLPVCERDDCPSNGFVKAISKFFVPLPNPYPLIGKAEKSESEGPYKGSPLERINNLQTRVERLQIILRAALKPIERIADKIPENVPMTQHEAECDYLVSEIKQALKEE